MITDDLFLSISNVLGIRVTPENFRGRMQSLSGTGGITNSVKTAMIIEILLAMVELEKKIDKNDK